MDLGLSLEVVSGNTCTSIAKNNGLDNVASLEALNSANACDNLQIGQVRNVTPIFMPPRVPRVDRPCELKLQIISN